MLAGGLFTIGVALALISVAHSFWAFAAIAVIALRNPFYSVLALVVHLVALAGLFLLLYAQFVAAAQVVVYAGAVMVLYVFVVAYVGGGGEWTAAGVILGSADRLRERGGVPGDRAGRGPPAGCGAGGRSPPPRPGGSG